MAQNYLHKLEAKFRNNLIDYDKIPINLKKKWNRHNFDGGYFRNLRNKKRYSLKKHEILNEIT